MTNHTIQKNNLNPTIVLGIAAHPDDLDYGASGTLAKYVKQGAEVHYLIVTDGSKGSEKDISSAELIKIRIDEQRDAVAIVGGKNVRFLNYADGELEVTMNLKKDIVREIRRIKPDVVITMDPTVLYYAPTGFINHPDHRAVGQATVDAVFPLARDHLSIPSLFKEGFESHKTKTLLLINMDPNICNYYEDITDTFAVKIRAITAHSSQVEDVQGTTKKMQMLAAERGKIAACELAESFVRLNIS